MALDQLGDLISAPGGAIQLTGGPRAANDAGGIGAEISLDCANTPAAPSGVRLRSRERFFVVIPPRFPFDMPAIYVPHNRWAAVPHVQWGFHLCLYAAPSVEWVPADGMFGLVERLTRWLEHAALDELDPDDQPLHPPVAYFSSANGVMVIHPDLGELAPEASTSGRRQVRQEISAAQSHRGETRFRLVVGIMEARREDRYDVVEWITRSEWLRRRTAGELSPQQNRASVVGAVAVLLDREMSFEYPKRAVDLVANLEQLGVPREELFAAIGEVAAVNHVLACRRGTEVNVVPAPLHVFVGTPSRRLADGVIRQHLVCWRVDDTGRFLAENLLFSGSADPGWADVGARAQSLLPGWIANAEISWVRVMESRPEVTVRRDVNSPAAWLLGRRVLVLGCGALGGPIAEFCVRGGAGEVHVVDKDEVTPGILVRQPYTDDDVGLPKATALAARLNRIRSDHSVQALVGQVQDIVLADGMIPPDADLVIDATADSAIASLLERLRSSSRGTWPAVLSVMVGHDAQRELAGIAKPGATGAGRHAFRQLALASRGDHAQSLKDVADDFFPSEPRTSLFHPEPGCSSPTFTGSAAQLAALAGHLLDAGLRALGGSGPDQTTEPTVAAVIKLDTRLSGPVQPAILWLGWPNHLVCDECGSGYEVRVSQPALARIRAEVRRSARVRGSTIETGGLLLGAIDDACKCVWIDEASGPPPDSLLSAVHFDHGVEGVAELVAYHRQRSGGLTGYLGMWHTHPNGLAKPSPTDEVAMQDIVMPAISALPRALIVILGGDETAWSAWVRGNAAPDIYVRLVKRGGHGGPRQAPPVPASHRADAWPGGWRSRIEPARRKHLMWWPPWRRRPAPELS